MSSKLGVSKISSGDHEKFVVKGMCGYLYRDSDLVELSHSREILMSMEYYERVFDYMLWQLRGLHNMKNSISYYKLMYLMNECCIFDHWDDPELVSGVKIKSARVSMKDIVRALLGGEFLKACECGVVLDNEIMCIINKDLCDRMYTLWKGGIFKDFEICVMAYNMYSDSRLLSRSEILKKYKLF